MNWLLAAYLNALANQGGVDIEDVEYEDLSNEEEYENN